MVNLELYVWIVRGKRRVSILQAMNQPMTPSQIHRKAKIYNEKISLNNTSDILRSFVERRIAQCLNVQDKMGRLYKPTLEGEEIREELMRM